MSEVAGSRDGPMEYEATVTSKGQITLPQRLRRELDVRAGDRVVFTRLPGGNWVLGRTPGQMPDIEALLGFGAEGASRRRADEIMEELRGRRPGEPLP
jgi:AbrB family looped-hinge helix DNA binding protein